MFHVKRYFNIDEKSTEKGKTKVQLTYTLGTFILWHRGRGQAFHTKSPCMLKRVRSHHNIVRMPQVRPEVRFFLQITLVLIKSRATAPVWGRKKL